MTQKIFDKNIHFFLIPFLGALLALLLMIFTTDKSELHLIMNAKHTPFLDIFFKFITDFGDIIISVIIITALLFYRFSAAVYLAVVLIIGTIITYYGKQYFGELRPFYFFQVHHPDVSLKLVTGAHMYKNFSFPSGHSVTAFALFFALSLIFKNRWISLASFIMASLVAYSRVYLSQHFAIDILIGALVGVICAWLIYPLYIKLEEKWKQKSLISVFKKN